MINALSKGKHLFGVNWLLLALTTLTLGAVADDETSGVIQGAAKWIEVRVEDADDRPIQNFEYARRGGAVTELSRGPDGSLPRFEQVSDPEGIVQIHFYPHYYKGAWKDTIIVGAPGYVTNFHVIEIENLAEPVVVLDRAGEVSGKILDSAGNPIDGAQVWIGPVPHSGHHGRPGHIMESDAAGRIASDRIPTGKISFGILHPDFIADTYDRLVTDEGLNETSFVLDSGASLTGSMSLGNLRLERSYVSVSPSNPDQSFDQNKQVTCEQGDFVVKGILPGTNRVRFRVFQLQTSGRDADWTLRETIDFVSGEEKHIEKSIPTGTSSLSGKIFVEGIPPNGEFSGTIYLVYKELDNGRSLQVGTYTNDKGEYTFSDLPSGTWDMSVRTWNSEDQVRHNSRRQIDLGDREALILDFDLRVRASK